MAESSKTLNKTVVVKSLAEFEAKVASGLPSGTRIIFNGVSVTVFTGTAAPTTSTKAYSIGDVYVDTTNTKIYTCTGIAVASNVYTYTWTGVATQADIADVIRYSAQSLSDAQKAQARENIDAWTAVQYTGTETSISGKTFYFSVDN